MPADNGMSPGADSAKPIEITLVGNDDTIGAVIYPDRVHPDLLESLRLRRLLAETGACECGVEISTEDVVLIWSGRVTFRGAGVPVTTFAVPHAHHRACPGHFDNLLRLLRSNNCEVFLINYLFPNKRMPL